MFVENPHIYVHTLGPRSAAMAARPGAVAPAGGGEHLKLEPEARAG